MSRESSPLEAADVICARIIMRATIDTILVMKTPKSPLEQGKFALEHQTIRIRRQRVGPGRQGGLIVKGRDTGPNIKGDKDLT